MSRWIPSLLRIGFAITFVLGIVLHAKAQGALPDIDTLLERVRLADEQRARLLENAWGTCDAVVQRGFHEHGDYSVADSLPPDRDGIRWSMPANHRITWYRRGTQHRADTEFIRKSWIPNPKKKKILNCLIVDVAEENGYVDDAYGGHQRVQDLSWDFNVHSLSQQTGVEPLARIERQLMRGHVPQLSWSLIGEVPCIFLQFYPPDPTVTDVHSLQWEEYHFAPTMDYALLKTTQVVEYPVDSNHIPFFTSTQLVATYAPSDLGGGFWLCKSLTLEMKEYSRAIEMPMYHLGRIRADWSYEALDSPLPADTFTLSGMGLPTDAPIYDLRLRGIRVLEGDNGFVVHPMDEYLFGELPKPIALETASDTLEELLTMLDEESPERIHDSVRNRVPSPTVHDELYRRLAFELLNRAPGDLTSLLEYALHVQDATLVRASVEPLLKSHRYYDAEPSTAAMDLVEQALADSPEGLTPLHVEALHLSTDVRKPGSGIGPAGLPIGYDRAMALLCDCLERGTPTVQAEALRYLPGREVRTQTSFEVIKATLQRVAIAEATDPGVRQLVTEKLRLVEDFAYVHSRSGG